MKKEEISNLVYEILEKYEFDQKNVISTYKVELEETIGILRDYRRRLDEIERLIRSHAVGVNNVYKEFHEMNEVLNLDKVKELSEKLNRVIADFMNE